MKRSRVVYKRVMASVMATAMLVTGIPFQGGITEVEAAGMTEEARKAVALTTEKITDGYRLKNGYFEVETGKYGQLTSIKIVDDLFPTNYIMNTKNAPNQNTAAHQWMGELMFQTRLAGNDNWEESMTSKSDSARKVELIDNKVVITYENATEEKGIQDFKLTETYYLEDDQLKWDITVENIKDKALEIGDFGLPLAFNEYWSGGDEIYETRVMDHSFIGKDSSYIYATRPSGLGQYLLLTPDTQTGAGFEYQDHWRIEERSSEETAWCQDQNGWANGLNVYYIHSKVIQKTNRGYLENTSLTLQPGESKTYGFAFSIAENEDDMKSTLYQEGLIDAVAVPGMTFAKNMPAKMYLHTIYDEEDITVSVKCPHELDLHEGNPNTVCNMLDCQKTQNNTKATYTETRVVNGEQYHIYELVFSDLGQNDVYISYDDGSKETELQFYIMDDVEGALNTHSDFMVEKTQWDAEGELYDKVFDDWMMDDKEKRGEFYGYWGWGDDWGLTHGQYIAEKNVFIPVAKEIEAVDQYLDVAIWNGLMQEHQEDYLIHDFLMAEPNTTPTYRGYAYAHIYNTYYSMYKIASKYPDMVNYIEAPDTYLMRACNILKALYSEGVAYNWETGIMGELTTPAIIQSLKEEGYYEEAAEIEKIMATKYKNFKNTKYPYGSEYSYDNTGEEAVYTLAKLNLAEDTANANTMMRKIDAKTRACRGLQPIWYHYANPTTICGENWWNFQYTAALAGYCMDDYLRLQDNGLNISERAKAERVNYAAKLANLTCINSGQIDADPDNIGTVSWTYQSEMGNLGGQGTGGGKLHNGWRQMAGEADLGLFGALQILSADVATDPVFGLFGYGCEVTENDGMYGIKPLDGLQTRLNLIDKQLYIDLDRDKYTYAKIATDCTEVELTIRNLEKTAHSTEIDVTGLADGAYTIMVDGKEVGTFKAEKGKTSTISVPLPQASNAKVVLKSGAQIANTAPVVDAGADKEVFLPSYAGIDDVTIAMDVKLTESQENNTRLFEFGDMENHYLYVSFKNGNKMFLSATDMETGKLNTVDTGMQIAADYWKNIALTIQDGDITLYVDGDQVAELKDSGFTFSGFGDLQRNYLGRSEDDAIGFLQGAIDNFEMYSYAMTEEEIAENFGDGIKAELLSVNDVTVITAVGEAAEFPATVKGLYSDGLYRDVEVTWDEVESEMYDKSGSFDVEGTIVLEQEEEDEKNEDDSKEETSDDETPEEELKAIAHVLVVEGSVQNLAPFATPEAIINTPSDLGGVVGLNDGYEPSSSRDTSHGVWHNWQGDQGGEAWVQYIWEEEVIITSQDAYYFTDGNFAPANVNLFYLNKDNEWIEMTGVKGLGVELNQYNYTSFDAVATKGIRMVMNPKTLGVGVIEWKVYGYTDRPVLDTTKIKDAIAWAEGLTESNIEEGWSEVQSTLQEAKNVRDNAESEQEDLDKATKALLKAIAACEPIDGNMAYLARVETSYVSSWENLNAVKDGKLPDSSKEKTVDAYGSWGNTSTYETITYKWPASVSIQNTGIYLWTDGGGILWPTSYEYSYLNGDEWVTVQNAEGFGLEEDKLNVTTFEEAIETTALQVKLNKQAEDYNGLGVFEWTVSANVLEEEPEQKPEEKPEEEVVIPEGSVNIAPKATALGSHDKVDDGGGLAELNDEDDALLGDSASTENGFWHNWEGFGEDAWVQYTWDKEVTLMGMDLYYFATWDGFKTKELQLSYLDENEDWIAISDAKGLGTKLNQWNSTLFAEPITTTAIKMVLTPLSNSVGILEWKVYGTELEEISDEDVPMEADLEELEELTTEEETSEEAESTTEEETSEEAESATEEGTSEVSESTTEEETGEVSESTTEEETSEVTESTTEEETSEVTESTTEEVTSEVAESTTQIEETAKAISEEVKEETIVVEMPEFQSERKDSIEVGILTTAEEEQQDVQETGIAKSRLHANVVDDGYPNMSLTYQWKVTSSPDGSQVVMEHSDRPISDITFDKEGTYTLTLTVSDGELSSEDTVVFEVKMDKALPEVLAKYDFSQEQLDVKERLVLDMSGSGYHANYSYNPNPVFTTVDEKEVLSMNGGFCGYVKLSQELTIGRITKEKENGGSNDSSDNQQSGGTVDTDNSNKDNNNSGNYDDNDTLESTTPTVVTPVKKQETTTVVEEQPVALEEQPIVPEVTVPVTEPEQPKATEATPVKKPDVTKIEEISEEQTIEETEVKQETTEVVIESIEKEVLEQPAIEESAKEAVTEKNTDKVIEEEQVPAFAEAESAKEQGISMWWLLLLLIPIAGIVLYTGYRKKETAE